MDYRLAVYDRVFASCVRERNSGDDSMAVLFRIAFFGVVTLAVFGGAAWYVNRPAAPEEEAAGGLPVAEEAEVVSEGGPAFVRDFGEAMPSSLSLPEFAEKEFVGSDFQVGRVLEDNVAYARHYITYKSNGLKISGIMNVPKGVGPFPLLLLNHGYIDPAIYTNGRGLKREQDYLARQGYVVVHSDYRNHAESDKDPAADSQFRFGYAEDVINAIQAIKVADLPYVDAERVGMLGHSMGGGVAWRIAVTQPGLVDAYVQFAPVSADERDNFDKWIRRRQETAQAILDEHGEPSVNPEFWDNISPLTFFENVSSPVLIHHGTADDSVPLKWSERAAQELTAQGKDVTLHVYPGEPHEFIHAWGQVMQRTTAFFDEHVK